MTLLGAQDFYFTLCSVNINQCLNSTFKYSWTLKKINMKTPAILNILFNSVMNFFLSSCSWEQTCQLSNYSNKNQYVVSWFSRRVEVWQTSLIYIRDNLMRKQGWFFSPWLVFWLSHQVDYKNTIISTNFPHCTQHCLDNLVLIMLAVIWATSDH